jgi:hypothetical protein
MAKKKNITLETIPRHGGKALKQDFSFELAELVLAKNKKHSPVWKVADDGYEWNEEDKVLVKKTISRDKAD